ncbi:hypothetical protein FJT64_024944 [Amphibalanus amphitrite]|uniref:Uncharacterized protein n=1 Tax=Amphibalanus amphitrite TaxID=1232801 RepID=A0A6A4WAR1_AMPAM|nr:hypothetical protein FJT64_024944 [Amphibalanus amphitrite]
MALESVAQAIQGLGSTRVKIDTGAFSLHYRATTTVFVGESAAENESIYNRATTTVFVGEFSSGGRGLLFYLPHWIWNALEGRTIASIVQDTSNRMFDQQRQPLCLANVTQYFRRTRGQHQAYLSFYVACEALNFVNRLQPALGLVTMPIPQLRVAALSRRAPLAHPDDLRDLSDALGLGDLFVLSLVAENVDSGAFQRLAYELATTLTGRRPVGEESVRPTPISDGPCAFKRPDSSSGVFKRPDSDCGAAKWTSSHMLTVLVR